MSNDELLKIGVSIPIVGEAEAACWELNSRICEITRSDVVFGAAGNSAPHVTIVLGTVLTPVLDDIRELVCRSIDKNRTFELAFGSPARDTVTGRYILTPVRADRDTLSWRSKLAENLSQFLVEPGRTSKDPHLTLGVVTSNYTEIDSLLSGTWKIPSIVVSDIDIAESGPKGTKGTLIHRIHVP